MIAQQFCHTETHKNHTCSCYP